MRSCNLAEEQVKRWWREVGAGVLCPKSHTSELTLHLTPAALQKLWTKKQQFFFNLAKNGIIIKHHWNRFENSSKRWLKWDFRTIKHLVLLCKSKNIHICNSNHQLLNISLLGYNFKKYKFVLKLILFFHHIHIPGSQILLFVSNQQQLSVRGHIKNGWHFFIFLMNRRKINLRTG